MKVKFQRQFFGPDHCRYRPGRVHEVPDSWTNQLPKDVEVIEEAPTSVVASLEDIPTTPAGKPLVGTKLK